MFSGTSYAEVFHTHARHSATPPSAVTFRTHSTLPTRACTTGLSWACVRPNHFSAYRYTRCDKHPITARSPADVIDHDPLQPGSDPSMPEGPSGACMYGCGPRARHEGAAPRTRAHDLRPHISTDTIIHYAVGFRLFCTRHAYAAGPGLKLAAMGLLSLSSLIMARTCRTLASCSSSWATKVPVGAGGEVGRGWQGHAAGTWVGLWEASWEHAARSIDSSLRRCMVPRTAHQAKG